MPFLNSIRLPAYLTQPQFPATSNVFRRADGSLKVLSAVVRKTFQGKTDYMPAVWHEKLRIALMHDIVQIEGDRLVGKVALEGEGYEINWLDFQDYPTAPAEFTVQVGDYNFTNDNCQTCEEATQLDLIDDNVGARNEGDSIESNAFTNDTIFCSPVTATITSINTNYVDNASIQPNGLFNVVLKANTPSGLGVWLATYRVTCPNGGYDEANIYGDITGSVEACQVPQNVQDVTEPTENSNAIEWDDSSPADGYEWQLYKETNLGLAVQSGSTPTASVTLTMLDPCTDYRFFVRAKCDDDNISDYAQMTFSTDCPEVGCGLYEVTYDNGFPDRDSFTQFYYVDCANNAQVVTIYNLQIRFFCLKESSYGNPVSYFGATSVERRADC